LSGVNPASAEPAPRAFALLRDSLAVQPDPRRGEELYSQHCSNCHSPGAWGKGAAAVPALAGQREYYLLEQLVQIASLERNVPVMHRLLSEQELDRPQTLRDLAAFLSQDARNALTEHGGGRDLSIGERIYRERCAMCHGSEGEGSEDEPIPAIAGQHYLYLLTQLHGFAAGHRGNVEPPVISFVGGLSERETQAVADYISRLKSPAPDSQRP
jgi:cytochrome c553